MNYDEVFLQVSCQIYINEKNTSIERVLPCCRTCNSKLIKRKTIVAARNILNFPSYYCLQLSINIKLK